MTVQVKNLRKGMQVWIRGQKVTVTKKEKWNATTHRIHFTPALPDGFSFQFLRSTDELF